jgi:cytochrome c oxidase subunit IV
MEFHDNYPAYEVMSNHSEEDGKPIRKKLWRVFWIMLVITIAELLIGTFASKVPFFVDAERRSMISLKLLYVLLTVVKAGYIVLVFMHLGHEVKFMKWTILAPYITFITYLVFIILVEGTYVGVPTNRTPPHKQYLDNRKNSVEHLWAHEKGAGHEAAAEPAKEGAKE